MRQLRLIGNGRCFYHTMSRVVDRQFILNDAEKRQFLLILRKLEAFHGVRVITYCLMTNHFHLLLEVPDPDMIAKLTADELLNLLPVLYSKQTVLDVKHELARAKNDPKWTRQILARYENRRGRLDVFMKELKQRFSQWYNWRHERRGTLWEDRYKSVLVEGSEHALMTMAAYIDLNPVRARMVSDPKNYRWSGYGEAMGGGKLAREGLARLLDEALGDFEQKWAGSATRNDIDWDRTTQARYRMMLFEDGELREGDGWTGRGAKAGMDRKDVEVVINGGGELSRAEMLRCRVRYFCDGAVLGSTEYVKSILRDKQKTLGLKRERDPVEMRGPSGTRWGDLRVARDLRDV